MKHGFTFRRSTGQTPVERSLAVNQPPEPPRPAGGAAKAAVWLSCLSPLAALLVDFDADSLLWNAAFLLLSLTWIFVLPLRKRFGSSWARMLYNLLPFLLRMGLLFARSHIDAAVLLLGLWTVATLLSWSTLQSQKDLIWQVAVTRLCQRSVILLAVILIVPSIVALRAELLSADSPPAAAEQAAIQPIERLDAAARDAAYDRAEDALQGLSRGEWSAHPPEERLETLLRLARAVSAALCPDDDGIDAVYSGNLPEDWAASYSRRERAVTISAALLGGTNPEAAARAILCAVYHSYERQLIEQTEEALCGDLILSWKRCLHPDEPDRIGFLADDGTAAEKSAHAFAEEEIKPLMQYAQALGTGN